MVLDSAYRQTRFTLNRKPENFHLSAEHMPRQTSKTEEAKDKRKKERGVSAMLKRRPEPPQEQPEPTPPSQEEYDEVFPPLGIAEAAPDSQQMSDGVGSGDVEEESVGGVKGVEEVMPDSSPSQPVPTDQVRRSKNTGTSTSNLEGSLARFAEVWNKYSEQDECCAAVHGLPGVVAPGPLTTHIPFLRTQADYPLTSPQDAIARLQGWNWPELMNPVEKAKAQSFVNKFVAQFEESYGAQFDWFPRDLPSVVAEAVTAVVCVVQRMLAAHPLLDPAIPTDTTVRVVTAGIRPTELRPCEVVPPDAKGSELLRCIVPGRMTYAGEIAGVEIVPAVRSNRRDLTGRGQAGGRTTQGQAAVGAGRVNAWGKGSQNPLLQQKQEAGHDVLITYNYREQALEALSRRFVELPAKQHDKPAVRVQVVPYTAPGTPMYKLALPPRMHGAKSAATIVAALHSSGVPVSDIVNLTMSVGTSGRTEHCEVVMKSLAAAKAHDQALCRLDLGGGQRAQCVASTISDTLCGSCKSPFHTRADCRHAALLCPDCGRTGHGDMGGTACPSRPCYHCQSKAHLAAQCPNNRCPACHITHPGGVASCYAIAKKVCGQCGTAGHTRGACRYPVMVCYKCKAAGHKHDDIENCVYSSLEARVRGEQKLLGAEPSRESVVEEIRRRERERVWGPPEEGLWRAFLTRVEKEGEARQNRRDTGFWRTKTSRSKKANSTHPVDQSEGEGQPLSPATTRAKQILHKTGNRLARGFQVLAELSEEDSDTEDESESDGDSRMVQDEHPPRKVRARTAHEQQRRKKKVQEHDVSEMSDGDMVTPYQPRHEPMTAAEQDEVAAPATKKQRGVHWHESQSMRAHTTATPSTPLSYRLAVPPHLSLTPSQRSSLLPSSQPSPSPKPKLLQLPYTTRSREKPRLSQTDATAVPPPSHSTSSEEDARSFEAPNDQLRGSERRV